MTGRWVEGREVLVPCGSLCLWLTGSAVACWDITGWGSWSDSWKGCMSRECVCSVWGGVWSQSN